MKKIFASLTALACAATIFTGCGKTDDDDDKKDSGKKGESTVSSDDLEDVAKDIIYAVRDKDFKAVIKYGLPDDLADSVFDLAADQLNDLDDSLDDYINKSGGDDFSDVELISVEKTEDIDENYMLILEKVFSFAITFTEYMEENNLTYEDMEDMDEDELMKTPLGKFAKIAETVDIDSPEDLIESGILDKIDSKITITEGCMAEVTVKSNGETDSMELPFYYIKGEGWNSDMIFYPAMIGYVKKSKQASLNSSASSLNKAANSTLADMDENSLDVSGVFIISSDESLNYNVSKDFDLDAFNKGISEYFSYADKLDYFVFINNGVCEYAACENPDNEDFIGTYPGYSIPSEFNGSYLETESFSSRDTHTLQELYDVSVSMIDNN